MFTYPFCYTPHPLCIDAAQALKALLARHEEWKEEIGKGKMFGVLVAERETDGERVVLRAFSGTLDGKNRQEGFVPPVFDLMESDYFQTEEAAISAMPEGIERKRRSQQLQQWLFAQFTFLNARGESKSLPLIFSEYQQRHNAHAIVHRSDMLSAERTLTPPSGSGECCAPRLLQEAFRQGLKPLHMAEFWMGASPKDEVRWEGNYYPACRARCKPILEWMLEGMEVAPNPLLQQNRTLASQLEIVYTDDALVVVNKPSGMLSVAGKEEVPNVVEEVKRRLGGDIFACHRLDMDTSGIMVLARNEESYKTLQRQFVEHRVEKRYEALLEHPMPTGETGDIRLLICANPYDRPRQIVSEEYGKKSHTHYEVKGHVTDKDKQHAVVWLYPHTGRTHQLRLHCASVQGLGNPIVGDRLYGTEGERLCLHAAHLAFEHPTSHERMTFTHTLYNI